MIDERLIRDLPMFSGVSAEKIAALVQSASVAHVDSGEQILSEDQGGNEMYVIQSGAIQVYTKGFNGDDIVLARLEPGQWFGEQALLTGELGRRNASVRALKPSTLAVISREALFAALGDQSAAITELRKTGEEERQQRRTRLQDSLLSNAWHSTQP